MNHVPSGSILESDYIDDYIDMLRNLDGEGGGVDTPLQNLLACPLPPTTQSSYIIHTFLSCIVLLVTSTCTVT